MTLFWLFFLAYAAVAAFEFILTGLNLEFMRRQGRRVPDEFSGVLDEALLAKTRAYTVAKTRLGWVSSAVQHLSVLVFIFGGVLALYNHWVVSLGWSLIPSALFFFLLMSAAQSILDLPFSALRHFRLEARYGFNTTTPGLWITDWVKSSVLTLGLTAVVVSAGFWLMGQFPGTWWLWVWAVFLVFSLLLMVISPYVLEPLFNRFTPIADDDPLAEKITALMNRAGIRISRIFTMDASRRSRHSNAYFSGLGPVKRIVLFDTLRQSMTEPEILAVLAHEAGHWKKKHLVQRLVFSEALGLAVIYGSFYLLQTDWLTSWLRVPEPTLWAKVLILGVLLSLVFFPLAPLGNWVSRRHEQEADDFAAQLTGDPGSLAAALVKLSKDNLANLYPHPWYVAFHYSHPPILARLRHLRSLKPGPSTLDSRPPSSPA